MPFTNSDGYRVHYQVDGRSSAPVLVLSNVLGTDLRLWDEHVAALADRYRLLRYDTRGHGQSEPTGGPYSISMLAEDVIGLLDYLSIERASFCGLSLGGMTGIWLGAHYGNRIDKLALCNTAAYLGPAETWSARIEAVRTSGIGPIAEAAPARWFTEGFRSREPETVARIVEMVRNTDPDGYVGCCAAIRDMDQRPSLVEIQNSTLVIAGTHDPATPPEYGRFLAAHISGAEYLELAASHLSAVEEVEQFTAALLWFLEK